MTTFALAQSRVADSSIVSNRPRRQTYTLERATVNFRAPHQVSREPYTRCRPVLVFVRTPHRLTKALLFLWFWWVPLMSLVLLCSLFCQTVLPNRHCCSVLSTLYIESLAGHETSFLVFRSSLLIVSICY